MDWKRLRRPVVVPAGVLGRGVDGFLLGTGGGVAAVGGFFLAAWNLRGAALVREVALGPVQYNVALGLVCLGAALVLLGLGRSGRWRSWLGWGVAGFAGGAVLEYVTGLDLHIDRIFFLSPLFPGEPLRYRMPLLSACCLVLIGTALGLTHGRGAQPLSGRRLHVVGILGAIVAVMAGMGVVGYALRVHRIPGWGIYAWISAYGALTQCACGSALLLWALREHRRRGKALSGWFFATGSLTLLAMIALISMANFTQLRLAFESLSHSNDVMEKAESLQRNVSDIQRGMRGYAQMGRPDMLQLNRDAACKARKEIGELTALLDDNPPQQELARAVGGDLESLLSYSGRLIDLRDAQGHDAVIRVDSTGEGLGILERLLADLRRFTDGEQRLLVERRIATENDSRRLMRFLMAGCAVTAALLLLANGLADWEMRRRRRTEQELQAKNVELVKAAAVKNQFLANMSHELRTPLNCIIGLSELLEDGVPGPVNAQQKEYIGDVLQSSHHLLQLINDVLDLAKVEAGKIELAPERFAPRGAAEQVGDLIEPLMKKKRILFRIDAAPGLDEVFLDPQKFKQVLFNLLSNAVKFTKEGGSVDLRLAPAGEGRFSVVVRDTGIGIKPEDLPRLFREFEQLDSSYARSYQGTGLGLALTRRIVEAQGGTIAVESEFGKGSAFTVTLPLSS